MNIYTHTYTHHRLCGVARANFYQQIQMMIKDGLIICKSVTVHSWFSAGKIYLGQLNRLSYMVVGKLMPILKLACLSR